MIEAPQLALIRTEEVGIDFYDKVIDRIDNRSRRPRGIVLHFAGQSADELFVVTVYRDATSRSAMFTDFSGPEIANELHESGRRTDVTRHEYAMHRLLFANSLDKLSKRPVGGSWSAMFVVDPAMTLEAYSGVTARANFPESWPAGLQIHMLFSLGNQLGILDVWSSKELAQPYYQDLIAPSAVESTGGELPEGQFENGWIDLHSLNVSLPLDDPLRDFSSPELTGSA